MTKALAVFETHVDGDDLLDRIDVARSDAVTPLMFEYTLLDQARAQARHIVLPEGTDERVLRAADILLRRRVVELTLLGPEEEVRGAAGRLGLDLFGAHVLDPADPELVERFAAEYAARRAHKGVTVDAGARRRLRRQLLRDADGRAGDGRRDGVGRDRTRPRRRSGPRSSWSRRARTSRSSRACS